VVELEVVVVEVLIRMLAAVVEAEAVQWFVG
jgi:hypothetical protein